MQSEGFDPIKLVNGIAYRELIRSLTEQMEPMKADEFEKSVRYGIEQSINDNSRCWSVVNKCRLLTQEFREEEIRPDTFDSLNSQESKQHFDAFLQLLPVMAEAPSDEQRDQFAQVILDLDVSERAYYSSPALMSFIALASFDLTDDRAEFASDVIELLAQLVSEAGTIQAGTLNDEKILTDRKLGYDPDPFGKLTYVQDQAVRHIRAQAVDLAEGLLRRDIAWLLLPETSAQDWIERSAKRTIELAKKIDEIA